MNALAQVSPRRVVVPLAPGVRARPSGDILRLDGETMGTTWSLQCVAADASPADIRRDVEAILGRIVAQMSPWERDSDLSRFNRAAPGTRLDLPSEFAAVLDYALMLAEDTGGAFDPTLAAVVEAFGFGPGAAQAVPERPDARSDRAAPAWRKLAEAREGNRLLQTGGIGIDLCAVAKGYAVDCIAEHLLARGCRDFLVEIGGELRGEGMKPDGMPWWIGIEAPRRPEAQDSWRDTVVALNGMAAATSGSYRRYRDAAAPRLHHLIDPRSGRPAANTVLSVTVLHPHCMCADALATALFVLGEEEGIAYAAARGIAALLVVESGGKMAQLLTPAFARMAA